MIVEVGGGLREYLVGDHALLDGYAEDEICSSGRGQPLIPWPNRIRDGEYEFDGKRQKLGLTEPARSNAIHGLVRWANWKVFPTAENAASAELTLHPQTGYPHTLELSIGYRLTDDGLAVTATATNGGPGSCPYGAGFHPYLTLGTDTIDELVLELPASQRLEADERGIPTEAVPVEGGEFDFRAPRAIGDQELDTGFTGLAPDADGITRARVSTEASEATLWMDSPYRYVMVFTGDTLAPNRRRRGVAIEPMTCAPNGFNSGDGLVVLEPGESHSASWGLQLRSPL